MQFDIYGDNTISSHPLQKLSEMSECRKKKLKSRMNNCFPSADIPPLKFRQTPFFPTFWGSYVFFASIDTGYFEIRSKFKYENAARNFPVAALHHE
ncbi:MAG: hypothetical protein LZF63_03130 [Nitrosomonas sp.]|nr:hypothetical protein [Nitrosomonas sp.]